MDKKSRWFRTVKGEIFILSVIFLTLVSILFAGMFLWILYKNNMKSALNSLKECNSRMVIYTEGMFHENESLVKFFSEDDTIINAGYGDVNSVLDIFDIIHENNTNITYVYSGYADGKMLIDNYDIPVEFIPKERPWYQAAQAADGVARLVYRDASTDEWLFSQCKKLVDDDGTVTGVISIDCSNESIVEKLSRKYQYESQRSFITASDGTVLIHPDEKEINECMQNYLDSEVWESIRSGENNYAEYRKNDLNVMAYFERIPETDFIVITVINDSEVVKPIMHSMLYLLIAIIGVSIVLSMVLSSILLYRFARPIMALGGRIQNIASGRQEKPQNVYFSNAEINRIAESIELIVKDIANREEQRKTAEYLSYHDSMTGMYNRRLFDEAQNKMDTEQNYPLALLCCDINGLKMVNDLFGHNAGDRLIGKAAEGIKNGCRPVDVPARIGGDEFAVIMPGASAEDVQGVIRRIKKGIRGEKIYGAEVSIAIGYAIKDSREQSIMEIMQQADKMMYERKVTESAEMKADTVENIIEAAGKEGVVKPIAEEEERFLENAGARLCPDDIELLKTSYRLRNLGLCSLLYQEGKTAGSCHTEMGYRILSTPEAYRNAAGYILHYTEHWDGSGQPACLSGVDIPLISRIVAVADAYFTEGGEQKIEMYSQWYDPEIIGIYREFK